MSRLNDPENFRGRVNYAAQVIAHGRRPTRAFDNCFENYDGDEVATAILRRSRKNTRLAANLQRYLSLSTTEAAAERLADIPTRKLPELARQTRAPQGRIRRLVRTASKGRSHCRSRHGGAKSGPNASPPHPAWIEAQRRPWLTSSGAATTHSTHDRRPEQA
jgi:crotonobetainyl-CoA:carnitine CoA-transferase CaiB-like acyl-CoA transferase